MDVNVRAFRFVHRVLDGESTPLTTKKTAARKGGLKGGPARAKAISPARRAEIARKASAARWNKESTA